MATVPTATHTRGAGIVLVAVVAPSVIANVFPADEAGVPMGIWATWAPVGGLMMFIVAPWLAEAGGWQVAWWYTAAAALSGNTWRRSCCATRENCPKASPWRFTVSTTAWSLSDCNRRYANSPTAGISSTSGSLSV